MVRSTLPQSGLWYSGNPSYRYTYHLLQALILAQKWEPLFRTCSTLDRLPVDYKFDLHIILQLSSMDATV